MAQRLERWLLPIYIAFVTLIYAPSLSISYAYADDYTHLAAFEKGVARADGVMTGMALGGRPVYALLTKLALSSLQSVSDMRLIRTVGVVGIGVLAWLIHLALRRAGAGTLLAIFAPLVICMMPPFQVYAAWTATSFYPLAAVCAGVAALLIDRADWHDRRLFASLIAAATVLQCIATSLYQPSAMMLWVFAAIFLTLRDYRVQEFYRRAAVFGAVGMTGMAVDFVELRLLPHLGFQSGVIARTSLSLNPVAKVIWFLKQPLVDALNLWLVIPTRKFAVVVLLFIVVGLFLFVRGSLQTKALKLGLMGALVLCTYIPNLVVAESWPSYRTQVALTSIIALYACFAASRYLMFISQTLNEPRWARAVATGAMMTGLLASMALALAANINITQNIVEPNYLDGQVIDSQLRALDLATTHAIYLRLSCIPETTALASRYDEMGIPTSAIAWAAPSMIYVRIHDINPVYASIPVILEAPGATFTAPHGSAVVDASRLRFYRASAPWPYPPGKTC